MCNDKLLSETSEMSGTSFLKSGENMWTSGVHPGRLTWNLQITHLESKMIFQTSMIVFHVNLPGCIRFLWVFQFDLLILLSANKQSVNVFVNKDRKKHEVLSCAMSKIHVTFSDQLRSCPIPWALETDTCHVWRAIEDVQPMNESMSCQPEGVVGGGKSSADWSRKVSFNSWCGGRIARRFSHLMLIGLGIKTVDESRETFTKKQSRRK